MKIKQFYQFICNPTLGHIRIQTMINFKTNIVLTFMLFSAYGSLAYNNINDENKISVIEFSVKNNKIGAPLVFGIPFPKGQLYSPDNVRIKDSKNTIIPSQITEVNTWEPADKSIQWIWVFIYSNGDNSYKIEYGKGIQAASMIDQGIKISNHWVEGGKVTVNTGAMEFSLRKGIGGFLDEVKLKPSSNPEDEKIIAEGLKNGRGNFVDLLDDDGMDLSKAEITFVRADKGSGPMHTILHIDGVYHYDRKNEAPFEMHIHVYKNKTYIKVLNTMIYTGVPTKHPLLEGQHAMIAISDKNIINEDSLARAKDKRWTQPGDQIAQMGLNLKYNLNNGPITFKTSYKDGKWWEDGESKNFETILKKDQNFSILQKGPNPKSIPPTETSSLTERLVDNKFKGTISISKGDQVNTSRLDGWVDISDEKYGIAIGVRNFFKEYPKEISNDPKEDVLHIYSWSPNEDPMGFERYSDEIIDGDEFDNFAQGIAKTTENIFYFHSSSETTNEVKNVLNYFLDPPIAHAKPEVYAHSKVFGDIAPNTGKHADFERGLKYKYEWMLYNKDWEPWYGMWDYGDLKNYFYKGQWHQWSGNEPSQDFMFWMEFMRTGDREMYLQGEAMSRITMDVNQIHWPKDPIYTGETNPALDYWKFLEKEKGSPYIGMGRRHADQHWISQLSAHVFVSGWITSYFLTGDHRGLEVAELTGEHYLKRIWGEHGLTGRRLYLSVLNLDWVYNATKDPRYGEELDFRVDKMINLQRVQQGNLVRDRYDYAQSYASHGLEQYLIFTNKDPDRIKSSIIENARRLRDLPPWGHEYESFLATIHPVLLGYKYTGDKSFLNAAISRSETLKMGKLPKSIKDYETQKSLEDALELASKLPKETESYEWIENGLDTKVPIESGIPIWKFSSGLRVFAWTHANNIPYLLYWLDEADTNKKSK